MIDLDVDRALDAHARASSREGRLAAAHGRTVANHGPVFEGLAASERAEKAEMDLAVARARYAELRRDADGLFEAQLDFQHRRDVAAQERDEALASRDHLLAQVGHLQAHAGQLLDRARAAEAVLEELPRVDRWAWALDDDLVGLNLHMRVLRRAARLLAARGTGKVPA